MELAIEQVFGKILRIFGLPGAAMVLVLYGGADISGPADAEHSLVIDMDAIVMTQVVVEPPVAFVRAFFVDFFDLVGQTLIFLSSMAQFPRSPFVVGRASCMEQFTGCFNGKSPFLMALLDDLINVPLSYF